MQGDQDGAAVLVVGWILRRQLLVNQLHFGPRLFHGCPGRQPAIRTEKMHAPKACGYRVRQMYRSPGFGVLTGRDKPSGHDAYDGIDIAAQRNRFADDLLITIELTLPKGVAEDYDIGAAGFVNLRTNEAAAFRFHCEHLEISSGDLADLNLYRLSSRGVRQRLEDLAPKFAERAAPRFDFCQVRSRLVRAECNQPIGCVIS